MLTLEWINEKWVKNRVKKMNELDDDNDGHKKSPAKRKHAHWVCIIVW